MPLLQKEISFLEEAIESATTQAPEVSAGSVAWHIDHSLKVINRVCNFLIKSDPNDFKWKFNRWRVIVFIQGKIPRGRAKAPKQVRPPENITIDDIKLQIQEVRKLLNTIEKLPSKSFFDHHIFGKLHLKKTIRFLEIHTNHHIKIIKEIIKAT